MSQKVTSLNASTSDDFKIPFISGVKDEFTKISWTEKKELTKSTKVVLWSTVFFGLGIYLVDLIVKGMLDSLELIGKWIAQ